MSLQNRVTPFGEVVAIAQRGLFTGNRGIIHDPATKTLLPKRWATKAWIICSCSYKDAHRDPMATRSWTELFFLDEAVALAAGHRPCFLCRREAALAFQAAWARFTGGPAPMVGHMDGVLHGERLVGRAKRLHPYSGDMDDLPDGAVFAADGTAFVVSAGRPFAWSADGYAPAKTNVPIDGLVTPPSTLGALRAGYRAVLHPSLEPQTKPV